MKRHSISAALMFAAVFAACGGKGPAHLGEETPPGELQSPCSPTAPCASWLLCVDGFCRDQPWPGPTAEVTSDVIPPPDVHGYLGADQGGDNGDVELPGDGGDVDVDEGGDGADGKPLPDLPEKDKDAFKPIPEDGDAGELELPVDPDDAPSPDLDAPGSEDTSEAEDIGEAEEDVGPEPSYVILYVSADSAGTDPGAQFLSLSPGQAWVADLSFPKAGSVIAMDVVVDNVFAAASCGRFRPALWEADSEDIWQEEPTWMSTKLQSLQGKPGSQTFLFSDPPEMGAGPLRVGLIYEEPCDGDPPIPWLYTDASGDLEGTWLWSPQPDTGPWVPGQFLGVEGRWAMRLLIEVPIP